MVSVDPGGRHGRWDFFWAAVLSLGLSGLPVHMARAQTEPVPPQPPTFELPEVVVPGRRPQPVASTPASVSVITREQLERLGVLTVGEALQCLPEVHVRQQGGLGALSLPSIRGASPNQVLVLIDGVPVNSVMQGLFDLSTVSTGQVEKIEVLRGPLSIYGGGALGGVINIITSAKPTREITLRGGGPSTSAVTGAWPLDGGQGSVLTADWVSSAGSRANSDAGSLTLAGRMPVRSTDRDRSLITWNHFQGELGVPGSTACPSPLARQRETRTILSARRETSADEGESLAQVYGWIDDFHFTDPAPCAGPSVDSRTATQVFGGYVQSLWHRSPTHLQLTGLEWQFQSLQDTGPVGNRQVGLGGAYVQDEWQVSPATLVVAGLRYDFHAVYGGQLNPRVGVVHVIRDGLTLHAGVGRTFRGPTFSELYFTPYNNPTLRPESAWSADVGLTWRTAGGVEVRTSLFGTSATDLIRADASFVPQNVGRATITGGSLEIAGEFSSTVSGIVNVTATRAVDDGTGQQLLRVPWISASAGLHVQLAGGTLSALATYLGSRLDVDPATFTQILMPGQVVTGLRFARGTPQTGQWQVGVDNLADLEYEPIAGYPAPGRTAFVSFTRSF